MMVPDSTGLYMVSLEGPEIVALRDYSRRCWIVDRELDDGSIIDGWGVVEPDGTRLVPPSDNIIAPP